MLLSKIIKMHWNANNKKWYECKGYIFTKWKDEFNVKVDDLPDASRAYVNVKCDCDTCIQPYLQPMTWVNYKRYVHKNGIYYCHNCANQILGSQNKYNTVLKNSKSFEQWCIENNRQDILNRWDYKLNNKKPNEITYGTHNKYWLICPLKIHKSELKNVGKLASNEVNVDCKACNSFAQWGIDNMGENFLEKYWNWDKNTVDPWTINKNGCMKTIWIKCQEKDYHGSYKTTCYRFTSGNRCPYCTNRNGRVHSLDSLGKLLENNNLLHLWSNKNKKSPYNFSPSSKQKVWWTCFDSKHEDYYRSISDSHNYEFRCPECVRERDESFLQEKVRLYLETLGYEILHEHKCTIIPHNPKKKGKNNSMPFDNEIIIGNKHIIVEVMGEQHDNKIVGWHKTQAKKNNTTPEYELHYQKLKDRYKRIYAKLHGYEYLDIWYYEDDKGNELNDNIKDKINNFIDQIEKG